MLQQFLLWDRDATGGEADALVTQRDRVRAVHLRIAGCAEVALVCRAVPERTPGAAHITRSARRRGSRHPHKTETSNQSLEPQYYMNSDPFLSLYTDCFTVGDSDTQT